MYVELATWELSLNDIGVYNRPFRLDSKQSENPTQLP